MLEAGACTPFGLRELTFLEERQQPWAKDLKHASREMKAATDAARTLGLPPLAMARRQAFVAHYHKLLAAGHAALPGFCLPVTLLLRHPRTQGRGS